MASSFPAIVFTVAEDKLKAFMSLMTTPTSESNITEILLHRELKKQAIIEGVKYEILKDIVNDWNKNKQNIENILIAEANVSDEDLSLVDVLLVPAVTELETYNEIKSMDKYHMYDIEQVCTTEIVDAGTIILEPQSENHSEIITNIYGEKVPLSSQALKSLKKGEGVSFDANNVNFKSDRSGIVVMVENFLEVLPVEVDGKVYADLDGDKMNFKVEVYPNYKTGKPIVKDDIYSEIEKAEIKNGVDEALIERCVKKCNQNKGKVEDVICKGTPSISGKDGWVEHLVNLDNSLKPSINNEGGTADFKNVSLIQPVEAGQHIARYHKATEGTWGFNLLGDTLPTKDGKDMPLPLGENTEVSPGDPNLILASTSGNARMNKGLIEVSECLVVEEDVDYNTGNIVHPKTVQVKRDVKATFNMEVGGSLEVSGIVEDSNVKVNGDVLIKAGFLGNGDGHIDAQGEVGIGFVRNQMVKCRKNLYIIGEAINSKLYSRRSIEVGGTPLGIVGGIASARDEIACEIAGNEGGTKTELQVGVDFALVDERTKTMLKIKELQKNKAKIDPHMEKLIRIKSVKRTLPGKEMKLLKQLVTMNTKIKVQLKELEERKELINKKLANIKNSRVHVRSIVYPGVVINIGNYTTQIQIKKDGGAIYVLRDKKVVSL